MLEVQESIEIVENATCKLGDLALKISRDLRAGESCDQHIDHAYYLTAYLQTLEIDKQLGFYDFDSTKSLMLYDTLKKLSIDEFNIPKAPGIAEAQGNPNITNDKDMFEPTLQPTVKSPAELQLEVTSGNVSDPVEVGESISFQATANFQRGTIKNGNATENPNPLVGDIVPIVGNSGGYLFQYVDSTGTPAETRQASPVIDFATYTILSGNNLLTVTAEYGVGTGTYFDSKNNPSNILDGDRAAGSLSDSLLLAPGGRLGFWQVGNLGDPDPTNSAEVRDFLTHTGPGNIELGGGTVLQNNATQGEYDFLIPSGYESIWFAIPDQIPGTTIRVILVESFGADVFGSFTEIGTISVEGANGFTPIPYKLYRQDLAVGGYIDDVTYKVIIE